RKSALAARSASQMGNNSPTNSQPWARWVPLPPAGYARLPANSLSASLRRPPRRRQSTTTMRSVRLLPPISSRRFSCGNAIGWPLGRVRRLSRRVPGCDEFEFKAYRQRRMQRAIAMMKHVLAVVVAWLAAASVAAEEPATVVFNRKYFNDFGNVVSVEGQLA